MSSQQFSSNLPNPAFQVAVAPAGTIVGTSDTQTLTNKKISKRVVALTDASPLAPNSDTTDMATVTELSQASTISAPTGTPVDGQELTLRIKSTTLRVLTFNGIFRATAGLALPAANTGGGKTDYLRFVYNSADSKWDYSLGLLGF